MRGGFGVKTQQLYEIHVHCNIRITDKQSATIYTCYIRINEIKRTQPKHQRFALYDMQNCAANSFSHKHTVDRQIGAALASHTINMHFFLLAANRCCCCSFAQRTMSLIWSYNLQCNQINACFLFVIYKNTFFKQKMWPFVCVRVLFATLFILFLHKYSLNKGKYGARNQNQSL